MRIFANTGWLKKRNKLYLVKYSFDLFPNSVWCIIVLKRSNSRDYWVRFWGAIHPLTRSCRSSDIPSSPWLVSPFVRFPVPAFDSIRSSIVLADLCRSRNNLFCFLFLQPLFLCRLIRLLFVHYPILWRSILLLLTFNSSSLTFNFSSLSFNSSSLCTTSLSLSASSCSPNTTSNWYLMPAGSRASSVWPVLDLQMQRSFAITHISDKRVFVGYWTTSV